MIYDPHTIFTTQNLKLSLPRTNQIRRAALVHRFEEGDLWKYTTKTYHYNYYGVLLNGPLSPLT